MSDPEKSPEPIKNPLTETEARDFIALQVKRELSGHVRRFITVFGIANVLALIAVAVAIAGMWFTIQNAAQTAAINVATQEASRISHEVVDPISKLTEDTYKSFSDRYSQLEEKRIRLDTAVSERASELKKLQQDLSDRDADVSKLKDAVYCSFSSIGSMKPGWMGYSGILSTTRR
jgi:hypothetical protein